MRAIILGALIVASGTLVTGCKREQNTRQQPQQSGQPAAPPSAPSGTGGAGSTAGSSDATGGGGQAGASQTGATGESSSEQGTSGNMAAPGTTSGTESGTGGAGKTSKPKSKKKAPKALPESPSSGGPTSRTDAQPMGPPADPPEEQAARSPEPQEQGTGGAGQVSGEETNNPPTPGVSGYDAATEPRRINPTESAAQEEEAIGGSGAPQSEEGTGGAGMETQQIPLGINPELPSVVQGPVGGKQPVPGSVGTREPIGGAAGSPGTMAVPQSEQPGTGGSGPVAAPPSGAQGQGAQASQQQGQNLLTVDDPVNGIYSVAVQPSTCVSKDGKAVAHSQLNPGDTIHLQWRMQNGKRVASWVDITRDVPREPNPGVGGSGQNEGIEGPNFDTEGVHKP